MALVVTCAAGLVRSIFSSAQPSPSLSTALRSLPSGDLRLQAIASYATFRDFQLAKRCLYLFAGVPFANGKVPAGMFEKPVPTRSGNGIYDYAILYSCSLLEYVQASGDDETGRELYPTALKQFDFLLELVDKDDLYFAPMDSDFESMDQERWNFIDCATLMFHHACVQER